MSTNSDIRLVQYHVERLKLDMKLVRVEHTEDKFFVYYTAKQRVDFRELIRALAKEFRTRIEMRQIGARECTKICGGIGPCGRVVCCNTWLEELQSIPIRLVKEGSGTVEGSLGCCGKLQCCLKYECGEDCEDKNELCNK